MVGAQSRSLQVLPGHPEILAALIDAVAQLPENVVFPRRIRGEPPRAEGAPVVGDVAGEDILPFVKIARAQGVRIIPALPKIARTKLFRLEAKILLLALADLKGAVPEE